MLGRVQHSVHFRLRDPDGNARKVACKADPSARNRSRDCRASRGNERRSRCGQWLLKRAASDLGANTFNRLRYVVLPLLAPAILAGALFAFTLSLDEFIITLFLIGSHNTLPSYIYTQVKLGITPEANALAPLLLAASLCLIALAFVLPGIVRRALRLVPRRVAS